MTSYLNTFCCQSNRKILNKGVLLYIHFNLFLALLLALIVFVGGIETSTSTKVSICETHILIYTKIHTPVIIHVQWLCSTVAAVLHYLFLCVFCWSLAEGIMVYVLIVRIFSSTFEKWYYFLPLGWGTQ